MLSVLVIANFVFVRYPIACDKLRVQLFIYCTVALVLPMSVVVYGVV